MTTTVRVSMRFPVQSRNSVALDALVTVVLVALKLCHVIGWSWGWVLMAVWVNAALLVWRLLARRKGTARRPAPEPSPSEQARIDAFGIFDEEAGR